MFLFKEVYKLDFSKDCFLGQGELSGPPNLLCLCFLIFQAQSQGRYGLVVKSELTRQGQLLWVF